MRGPRTRFFSAAQKLVCSLLIVALVASSFWSVTDNVNPPKAAEAAPVVIDDTVNTATTSSIQSGSQTVFVNDQTGYRFFRDAPGYCVYRKTTDAGLTWSATTTVDSQIDCIQIQVWYDRWTPAATTSFIHIVTMDTGSDDLFYNRLDTESDTLLMGNTPVSAVSASGNSIATFSSGANYPAITRSTTGEVFLAASDASDSYIVRCANNCSLASSWLETTPTSTLDRADDYNLLAPLSDGRVMLINRDISAEDIRARIWNGTDWGAGWTAFDLNATDNATYDTQMAVSVSTSSATSTVYLTYLANTATLGTDDQIRVARFVGNSWSTSTATTTAPLGLTSVNIGLNSSNDDVFVIYSGRTTPANGLTGNVYWITATSTMRNWSTRAGPLNSSASDILGVDLGVASDQRLYASWFERVGADLFGDTLSDTFPGIRATTTGTATAAVVASSTTVYLGGAFVLTSNYAYRDIGVTSVTLTETGSIHGTDNISNVRLFYESDVTAPYNCVSESYSGSELQFGLTDSNGFSGADGVSSFTSTPVTVGTTSALCLYVVMDILDSAPSSSTVAVRISNPSTDISTDSLAVEQTQAAFFATSTLVRNDTPTQTHYHWRNDNGSETTATSRTGGTEDTTLNALQQGVGVRLRLQVSNEGSTSTPPLQYRLEYAQNTSSCEELSVWNDVGASGGDFLLFNSSNLTNGANTTNIAVATGGTTDENLTFLTPNGGVRDTTSQTGPLSLTPTQFVELEYALVASTSATEGNSYCFRVTDAGTPLAAYSVYPRANIAADVSVAVATSSQRATTTVSSTDVYLGSAFILTATAATQTVTSITISEQGSVNAETGLTNLRLRYDRDSSSPYNCASESYNGTEPLYGVIDTDGMSGPNGTSTFTDTVDVGTSSVLCLYVVLDVTASAQNDETIDVLISSPASDLTLLSGGSVAPTVARDLLGSTTILGAIVTQTGYHWRNDNGTQATATSRTTGVANTPIANISQTTPVRLRLQISNEGFVTAPATAYQLEYGTKLASCAVIGSWQKVDEPGAAWSLSESVHLTDGEDSTNILEVDGGIVDPNPSFVTPNAAVRDATNLIATTSLTTTDFLEAEFSLIQTNDAGFDTTYCFRLVGVDTPLNEYDRYPELTTAPERDFEIQRGTFTMTSTTTTLTAGVHYVAPAASTSAFIRITNAHHTGGGSTSTAATQNSDDVTVHIENASNIMSSVRFVRPSTALGDARVSWEIVEFIGTPGSDNEMIVRQQTRLAYGTTALTATGTAVSGVADDADIVVFITGQSNPDTGAADYNTGQSTSAWLAASNQAVFTRGEAGGDAAITSFAVVEFTGLNWKIQRTQHTYTAAGVAETEAITAVNSLSRTFLHTQKRSGVNLPGVDEFGHEVWLSSIGFVSFFLESGATSPNLQTSVAWVIENTQVSAGAMEVTRSNGSSNLGTAPLTLSVSIGKTLTDLTNTSLFVNTRAAGTGTNYPRPIVGATIASTTAYELWRSNTGSNLTYRTEVVEWPTAGLAVRQLNYQFYVDNNSLLPDDPWPPGPTDLGENFVLTQNDESLGEGDRIRIRMNLRALNATLPANTQAYKLQYGLLTGLDCTAIAESGWVSLGDSSSSTVWRGFNATGTSDGALLSDNPPTGGDLVLTGSTIAGTFEESNDTPINSFAVPENGALEFDWLIEQNGALGDSFYCFRMVESDGEPLASYENYPQIRTASFSPRSLSWRWFDDEQNLTPTSSLAAQDVSPINIANEQILKLRVAVDEVKNVPGANTRFRHQYSDSPVFLTASDVVATSSCLATSTWCYENGAGVDNAIIASTTLTGVGSCVSGVGPGCGTHNESPQNRTGFTHQSGAVAEYEFTIRSAAPRVNRLYYFRLYDVAKDLPVPVSDGFSYPSLVTEGGSLVFINSGQATGTLIAGVTTTIATSPNSLVFGTLAPSIQEIGAHRLTVDTNGTQGYRVLVGLSGPLENYAGETILGVTGTNGSPTTWATGCALSARSCFGYHTTDGTLEGGSTRFAPDDTYARLSTTTVEEVAYSSQPSVNENTDVVYRILIRGVQAAGSYQTTIRYVSVPIF
jgi:hypothetical protein